MRDHDRAHRTHNPDAADRSAAPGGAQEFGGPASGSAELDELFVILRVLRRQDSSTRRRRLPGSLGDAVAGQDKEAVRAFVASGRAPDLVGALATAAGSGNLEMTELLLSLGAPVSKVDDPLRGAYGPLARAAGFGDPRVVRRLLEAEPRPRYGEAALLNAVSCGQLECVRALVEAGIDPEGNPADSGTNLGQTLRDLARERGYHAVLGYLEGRKVTFRTDEEAAAAAGERRRAEREAMATLFEHGMEALDPFTRYLQATPAAGRPRRQNIERALEIIRSGSLTGCINAVPVWGDPALVEAAEAGLAEIVNALLTAGADPNIPTRECRLTALMVAVKPLEAGLRGDPDICRMLLAAGSNPNAMSDVGATALIWAADAGEIDMVRMLVEAGADPTIRTGAGETAIAKAQGPDEGAIEALLRSACNAWEAKAGTRGTGVRAEGRPRPKSDAARGAKDFLRFLGHPEWGVIAVQAGLPEIAAAFALRRGAERVEPDVAQRTVSVQPDDRIVPILRLRDHGWTLIYDCVGHVDLSTAQAIPEDARALSRTLGTRAVSFLGDDTSSSLEYRLFENGALLEMAQSDGSELVFESTLRARPRTRSKEALADSFFRSIGVYWPTCYPENDGRHACLVLDRLSPAAVERVDLVIL